MLVAGFEPWCTLTWTQTRIHCASAHVAESRYEMENCGPGKSSRGAQFVWESRESLASGVGRGEIAEWFGYFGWRDADYDWGSCLSEFGEYHLVRIRLCLNVAKLIFLYSRFFWISRCFFLVFILRFLYVCCCKNLSICFRVVFYFLFWSVS